MRALVMVAMLSLVTVVVAPPCNPVISVLAEQRTFLLDRQLDPASAQLIDDLVFSCYTLFSVTHRTSQVAALLQRIPEMARDPETPGQGVTVPTRNMDRLESILLSVCV